MAPFARLSPGRGPLRGESDQAGIGRKPATQWWGDVPVSEQPNEFDCFPPHRVL
jgi:hypothetical protein